MADKAQKDMAKWKVAIIGIGFVIGVAMLAFGGGGEKSEVKKDLASEYRATVEAELEELCEAMTGGEVKVFVSLEDGFSYSYALDSRGGVVTVGSGSSEEALVESVRAPVIAGVGVVCDGNADRSRLVELISSSLGIGTNKIFVTDVKKIAGQS